MALFLHKYIDFQVGKEMCTIKLKALSKLDLRKRFRYKLPTFIGEFERCWVRVFDDPDGDIGGISEEDQFLKITGDGRNFSCLAGEEDVISIDEDSSAMMIGRTRGSIDVGNKGCNTTSEVDAFNTE